MGVILAKFRREKTTYQLLERLEEKILNIEEFSISTQERQKRFVGNFLIISIGLYVITFVVFYLLFFPPTWLQRIAYTTPLLMFPIVIILLKRLFAWYYQRKLNKNASQLSVLRTEKKKIIEKVMDTETYKVAIDILHRFGDSSTSSASRLNPGGNAHTFDGHRSHNTRTHHHHHHNHSSHNDHFPATRTPPSHTQIPLPTATPHRSLAPSNSSLTPRPPLARHLLTPGGPKTPAKPSPFQASAIATQQPSPQQLAGARTPYNNGSQQQQQLVQRIQTPNASSAYRAQQMQMQQQQQQQYPQTPFPIINYNAKGFSEKLLDFLIGDGVSSRYGMICAQCLQHNGMATLEEYEYSAFRCAFCKTLNPSRKLRPIAPKIASADDETQQSSGSVAAGSENHPQSDTSSGSDSEGTVDVGSTMPTKAAPASESDNADAEKTTGEKKND